MTITALGFGFIESIVYGIGASVPVVLDIVLVIVLIRFIRKARKQERYTEPLPVREGE